jgi:antitoxin component YwqK of YwqJK toxin-antitoxin module
MMIRRVLLSFFLYYSCCLAGQTVIICSDDSELQEKYMGFLENKFNQSYLVSGYFTFKERLPDGEYIYLGLSRNKFKRIKDYNRYIIQKGSYVDSLRHGKFIIYSENYRSKGDYKRVDAEINYSRGLLDGHVIHYYNHRPRCEGNYTLGLRDGFFYYYDWEKGVLWETLLYDKGELIAKSPWGRPTVLVPLK